MKLDLLTNAIVVDDAIRFVSSKTKESIDSNEYDKKSNEPDYDEDDYQLENEQQEESRETATTNQVF